MGYGVSVDAQVMCGILGSCGGRLLASFDLFSNFHSTCA